MSALSFVAQAIANDANIHPGFAAGVTVKQPVHLKKWPAPVRTEADRYCWSCQELLRDCNCIEDPPKE